MTTTVPGLPSDVSVHGWRTDALLQSTHLPVLVVIAGGVLWIGYQLARSRLAPVAGPASEAAEPTPRALVVAVLAIAALIFVAIDGRLMCASRNDRAARRAALAAARADPATVRIEINAQQWAWNVRYAGVDGRFATADDVVVVGELRLPIDRPVIIQLASSDVVHSLSIPNLRVKMDAVPGRINTLTFRARSPGDYEIACAQFCGTAHYKMRGLVRVVAAEEFERWHRRASADARAVHAEDTRGRGSSVSSWGWPWRDDD